MQFGSLFAKLAGKAGLDLQDPQYASVLGIQLEIPEDAAGKIISGMSMEEAKNNYELQRYFYAKALDGTDQAINLTMTELGIAVEDRAEVEAEKSTMKKVALMAKKIDSLKSKMATATNAEKSDLTKKINDLQGELAKTIKEGEDKVKQINADWQNRLTNSTHRSVLAGRKYPNTTVPHEVNVETFSVLFDKELRDVEGKLVYKDGKITLKNSKDESLDLYSKTNEKLVYEEFVESLAAKYKMIPVNDSVNNDSTNLQNVNGQNRTVITGGNSGPLNRNLDYKTVIEQQLKEAEAMANGRV